VIIMPYLIRKQPGNPSAPDFAPLGLWAGALALFGVVAVMAGFWPAALLNAGLIAAISVLSWRGAQW
jgi:hypothetical protein